MRVADWPSATFDGAPATAPKPALDGSSASAGYVLPWNGRDILKPSEFWYPRFPARLRRAVVGWPLAAKGAYSQLVDYLYECGEAEAPDDDRALAEIVGCTAEEWSAVAVLVRSKFTPRAGKLHHAFVAAQLRSQNAYRNRRIAAAHAGANARWSQKIEIPKEPCEPDANRIEPDMRFDAKGQDRTLQRKEEVASLIAQVARQGAHAKGNGANYDDPATRKQRWVQKIADELGRTLPTERAEKIILGYQRGEQWAKAEFEKVNDRIKQRQNAHQSV